MKFKQVNSRPKIFVHDFKDRNPFVYIDIIAPLDAIKNRGVFLNPLGHLLEHYLARKGSNTNMETHGTASVDYVNMFAKIGRENFAQELRNFYNNVLNNPIDDKETFNFEKSAVLHEIDNVWHTKDNVFLEKVKEARFSGKCIYAQRFHDKKLIARSTLKDLKNFYTNHFLSSNLVVLASGYKIADFSREIKKINFRRQPARSAKYACAVSGKRLEYVKEKISLPRVFFSFPGLSAKSNLEEKIMLRFFLDIFRHDQEIGIFPALRKMGLYDLSVRNLVYKNSGTIIFWINLKRDKIPSFVKLFLTVLNEVKSQKIDEKIIAKRVKIGKLDLAAIDKSDMKTNSWILDQLLYDLRPLSVKDAGKVKITPEKLMEFAKRTFGFNRLNLVIFGNIPLAHKKKLKNVLAKIL